MRLKIIILLILIFGLSSNLYAVDGRQCAECNAYKITFVGDYNTWVNLNTWAGDDCEQESQLPINLETTQLNTPSKRIMVTPYYYNGGIWSARIMRTLYISPAVYDQLSNWMSSKGIPWDTDPNVYWSAGPVPGTCTSENIPCAAEKAAAIAACPSGTGDAEIYVDWTGWDEATCSGAVCCPTGAHVLGGYCINFCFYKEGRDPDVQVADYGGGLCIPRPCTAEEIIQPDGTCKSNCIAPATWDQIEGICRVEVVQCGVCETRTPDNQCLAAPICPSGTYLNEITCQCTDTKPPECGLNMHYNGVTCVPDEVTRCEPVEVNGVMTEQIKNVDGDCMPAPAAAEKPVEDPLKTPEENLLPIAGAIKDDTSTLVKQGNETNKYLENMTVNTQKIVENQGVINENLKKNTSDITGTLNNNTNDIVNAIQGIGDISLDTSSLEGAIGDLATAIGEEVICPEGYQVVGKQCEKILVCPEGYEIIGNDCSEILPEYEETGLGDTVGSYIVGDYNGRYTAMVNTIKSGPLATMLTFGSIPTGASAMTIGFPESFGGDQTFDFAEFDNAWSILRTVLLVIFSFLFIRIVFLKR